METIDDTGISEEHILLENDTDWIKFIPSSDTSYIYSIYIILEDALYDTATQEDFEINFSLKLVKPNGYEVEEYLNAYITQVPENPITSTNYISWENSSGVDEVWFIKIDGYTTAKYKIEVR